MKVILFSRNSLIRAAFLLLFLLQSGISKAQNRVYAHEQTSGVFGVLCLGCTVENPERAIGGNEDDYATMVLGTVLLGGIEQTLFFPELRSDTRLVIGVGTNNIPLSVQLLSGVSLETMNGNTSNGDLKTVDVSLLKLGAVPNRATIEFKPEKPYNGVRIRLTGGVLSLGGGFRVYYAYQDPLFNLSTYSRNGQVTLDGNIPLDGAQVTLINTSGKEVFRSKLQSKTFESRLPEGVYFMTLQTKEGKTFSKKILIK